MARVLRYTEMEIFIKVSLLTECRKDMVNMFGKMEACIKEISSKD